MFISLDLADTLPVASTWLGRRTSRCAAGIDAGGPPCGEVNQTLSVFALQCLLVFVVDELRRSR